MTKKRNFIFRASFTKNGITYYASDYGKKAFLIYIDDNGNYKINL